jgi:DNA-binding protein YbaB
MMTDPHQEPPSSDEVDLRRAESLFATLDGIQAELQRAAGVLTTALSEAAPNDEGPGDPAWGQAPGGKPGPSQVRHRGEDSSGTVRVAIDGHGKVVDVELTESWSRTVGPAGLSGALMEAVDNGERRRAQAWGNAVAKGMAGLAAEDAGVPMDRVPAPSATANPLAASPTDPSAQLFASGLRDLLWDVDNKMDEYTRVVAENAKREIVSRGDGGQASVTVRGGHAIVRVDLDARWLASAERPAVVAEIRTAFANAYRAATKANEDAVAAVGPFAELLGSVANMETLLGRLGLGSPRT